MSEFDPHSLEPFWDTWYIDSLIGEGSFGTVYKIYREEFGTKYYSALKIISVPQTKTEEKQVYYEGMDDNTATQYFRGIVEVIYKEIVIMSELKGKTNIVSYEDHKIIHKKDSVGFHILIRMELLESLNDYLLHEVFSNENVVELGKDLCKALILCQKRNLIHRDIKPANIFVTLDGDYKLGDFGIARQLEGAQEGLSIKGTFGYMAPEVYLGNTYDERVDIYSLGMVLYYYLNNKKGPFTDTSSTVQSYNKRQEALRKRFSGEKLPKPVLASERLAQVVLTACEFDPKARYSSADQFLHALNNLTESDMVTIPAASSINNSSDGNINDETVRDNTSPSLSDCDKATDIVIQQNDLSDDNTSIIFSDSDNLKKNGDKTVLLDDLDESIVHMDMQEKIVPSNSNKNDEHKNIEPQVSPRRHRPIAAIVCLCILLIGGGIASYLIFFSNKDSKDTTSSEESLVKNNSKEDTSPEETPGITVTIAVSPTPEAEEAAVTDVTLENGDLKSLSSIPDLEKLKTLSISANGLTSIEELKDSRSLEYLIIENNKVAEIKALTNMKQLIWFDASKNQITDISPLSNLTSLQGLLLSNNNVNDVVALANLSSLTELRLDGNKKLTDISALSKLDNLQYLTLNDTNIKDLTPLFGLKKLSTLNISNTKVSKEQIIALKKKIPNCEISQ